MHTDTTSKGVAAHSPISRDYEAYMDLIKRANSLRSMGYIASADAMLQRAWRAAGRCEAMAVRPFVGSNPEAFSKEARRAAPSA